MENILGAIAGWIGIALFLLYAKFYFQTSRKIDAKLGLPRGCGKWIFVGTLWFSVGIVIVIVRSIFSLFS